MLRAINYGTAAVRRTAVVRRQRPTVEDLLESLKALFSPLGQFEMFECVGGKVYICTNHHFK